MLALREMLERSNAPVEIAQSLPPACYTDAALMEAETLAVFGGWVGVGRADIVAEPGSYAALDFAGK